MKIEEQPSTYLLPSADVYVLPGMLHERVTTSIERSAIRDAYRDLWHGADARLCRATTRAMI